LNNFSLQCEYVDIGTAAVSMLDQTLVDGKAYIHGTTWRTSTASLPASTTGAVSLLAGVRASSVKSLFVRFAQNSSASTYVFGTTNQNAAASNGKYDATNPMINSINFSVGGIKFPQTPTNPLLAPSQAFRDAQLAMGSWNSALFTSATTPNTYCRLSGGYNGPNLTPANGSNLDYNYTMGTTPYYQSQFIYGQDLEVVMRKSLLSGLNCTSAPIFLEIGIAYAPTFQHTAYVQALIDHVIIHDVRSGDITVRL